MLDSMVQYFTEDPKRTVVQGCALLSATLAIWGWRHYFGLRKKDKEMTAELKELDAHYDGLEQKALEGLGIVDMRILDIERNAIRETKEYLTK